MLYKVLIIGVIIRVKYKSFLILGELNIIGYVVEDFKKWKFNILWCFRIK